VRLGAVGMRRLYGWAAATCLPGLVCLLVAGNVNGALIVGNLLLSFLALWQTTRVEAITDPTVDA
jgi:hypothetical protein